MAAKCKEINAHSSYHGVMTEGLAEMKLLSHCGVDSSCYFIRYCDVEKSYLLSALWKKGRRQPKFVHLLIKIEDGFVEGAFNHISDLLMFYQNSPISNEINSFGVEVTGQITQDEDVSEICHRVHIHSSKCS